MDVIGKLLAILASAWAVCASAQSQGADTSGHPYQPIVTRNVFGLHDPPPLKIEVPTGPPPPKITLQGINTILGRKQVLFKVAAQPKPGQPGSAEISMVLSPGESQDDIKVLEIDESTGTVKFDNHGTEETKTMENDAAKPAFAPVTIPGAANPMSVIARPLLPTPTAGAPTVPPGLQSIPTRASARLQAVTDQSAQPPRPPIGQ